MSIRTRLLILVGLFSALAIAVSAIGINGITSAREAMNSAIEHQATGRYLATLASRDFEATNSAQNALLSITDEAELAAHIQEEDRHYADTLAALDRLKAIADADTASLMAPFREAVESYHGADEQLRKLLLSGEADRAIKLYLKDGRADLDRLLPVLQQLAADLDRSRPSAAARVRNLTTALVDTDVELGRMVLETTDAEMEESARRADLLWNQVAGQQAALVDDSAEGEKAAGRIALLVDDHHKLFDQIAKLTKTNNRAHAAQIAARCDTYANAARKAVEDMVRRADEDVAATRRSVDELNMRATLLLVILSLAGIAGALAFAIMVIRRIGQGVEAVRRVAAEVTDSSAQLKQATQSIAQRASEEASSLEETSSTMEEMTATVEQNRSGAQRAKELSDRTSGSAQTSAGLTNQAADAMRALKEAGAKIANITETVSEIAFQTNILALNASVEAARAGEHGRGFTVVASEVRALAQRSAVSAREISSLISESLTRIDRGAELVARSSEEMLKMVDGSREATTLVSNIAAAAQEQASGISQVSQAMLQLNQVVQANSAQAEELSASSENLSTQARELAMAVALIAGGDGGRLLALTRRNGKAEPHAPAPLENGHAAPHANGAPLHAAPREQDFSQF